MTQFSLAELFGITIRESANDGSDFTNPSADYRRLFLGEDGTLHLKDSAGTVTTPSVSAGAVTTSGLTMATARLLGRTTASTGAVEEITVGSGLSLAAGSLTATGGAGGSFVWLQRQTASTSATLDCTSFISATYEAYELVFTSIVPATDNTNFLMRMGTGGGPTYDSGANYGWSSFRWAHNGSAAAGAASGQTSIGLDGSGGVDNGTGSSVNGTLRLFNPGSAVHKRITWQMGYTDNAGALIGVSGTATYQSTTAVTAVRFFMASGNIASGTIDVFGLTHA